MKWDTVKHGKILIENIQISWEMQETLDLVLLLMGSILFWNRTQNIACGCICCAIQPPTLGMHAGVELHDCFAYTRPFVTWEGLWCIYLSFGTVGVHIMLLFVKQLAFMLQFYVASMITQLWAHFQGVLSKAILHVFIVTRTLFRMALGEKLNILGTIISFQRHYRFLSKQ